MIHRGCSQPRRSLSHEGSVRLRCGRKRGTVKTCLFFSLYHARTSSLHEPSGLLLTDLGIGDWFGGLLFSAGPQANEAVQNQLSALSFSSLAVIFGAGLVTSLSLCTVGVLPLTLVYI